MFKHEGLCINPRVNLVTNIGFDAEGTHMTEEVGRSRSVESAALPTPLRHPERVALDRRIDRRFFYERFGRPFGLRLRRFFERRLGR